MALIKHGNNALSNVTAFPSAVPTGKPVLLSTATASSSSSIEFTSGIDSTYDIYKFECINIHPSVDGAEFQFNLSTNGGSSYGVTKTSSHFRVVHNEADTATSLQYDGALHLAQSTSAQQLVENNGADNDQNASGTIYLFQPSSSIFVKHYLTIFNTNQISNYSIAHYIGGYANTTTAINAIKFTNSSGNIDAGTIKMYGIKA